MKSYKSLETAAIFYSTTRLGFGGHILDVTPRALTRDVVKELIQTIQDEGKYVILSNEEF